MNKDRWIDLGLLVAIVFAWSTSWIALKSQVGVIAPEVSVFWRFLLAAPLTFVYAAMRGSRLAFPMKAHLGFMAMGALIFSSNFILFYYGAAHLPSGLLSVVFSLASVINLLLGFVLFSERISLRIALGGLAGFLGVALMFQPEIAKAGAVAGSTVLFGLGLCTVGTLCFCSGNMISSRLQRHGIPVIGATAWGMAYGTLWAGFLGLVSGDSFELDWTPLYLASLAWLVLVSTVLAFLTYLTLLGRIGAARAGYATVLFPAFALLISSFVEGYVFTPLALIGLALVAFGNLLVLRRG
jgi:drug/metabolite transporter (DMT)-like permease